LSDGQYTALKDRYKSWDLEQAIKKLDVTLETSPTLRRKYGKNANHKAAMEKWVFESLGIKPKDQY
jgi:hypothetical protein